MSTYVLRSECSARGRDMAAPAGARPHCRRGAIRVKAPPDISNAVDEPCHSNRRTRCSRFLADPATHGGAAVTRIDTHGAVGVSGRRSRAQGQARGAIPVPRLFDAREAQGRLRGRARGQPAVRARRSIAACADHARGRTAISRIGGDGDAGGMGARDAPLRRERDARPSGGRGQIDDALADALGRAVAAAHARRRSVDAEPWIAALVRLYRAERRGLRANSPICFAPATVGRADRSEPRRASRACNRCCVERGRHGADPPRPRRPASRQYRADRRQAGAVRRASNSIRWWPPATCSTTSPSC